MKAQKIAIDTGGPGVFIKDRFGNPFYKKALEEFADLQLQIRNNLEMAVKPIIKSLNISSNLDAPKFIVSKIPRLIRNKTTENNLMTGLFYDSKEKILTRTIGERLLTTRFKGGEAKRLNLFERLKQAKSYIKTETLRDELNCPSTEAVRKIVQGINNKVFSDLNVKDKIIEGRPGFGYRINPRVSFCKT